MNQKKISNTGFNDKTFLLNKFISEINDVNEEILERNKPFTVLITEYFDKIEECLNNLFKLKWLLTEVYISMSLCQNILKENEILMDLTVTFRTDLKDLMKTEEVENDETTSKKKKTDVSVKNSNDKITNLDDLKTEGDKKKQSEDNGDEDKKEAEHIEEDKDDNMSESNVQSSNGSEEDESESEDSLDVFSQDSDVLSLMWGNHIALEETNGSERGTDDEEIANEDLETQEILTLSVEKDVNKKGPVPLDKLNETDSELKSHKTDDDNLKTSFFSTLNLKAANEPVEIEEEIIEMVEEIKSDEEFNESPTEITQNVPIEDEEIKLAEYTRSCSSEFTFYSPLRDDDEDSQNASKYNDPWNRIHESSSDNELSKKDISDVQIKEKINGALNKSSEENISAKDNNVNTSIQNDDSAKNCADEKMDLESESKDDTDCDLLLNTIYTSESENTDISSDSMADNEYEESEDEEPKKNKREKVKHKIVNAMIMNAPKPKYNVIKPLIVCLTEKDRDAVDNFHKQLDKPEERSSNKRRISDSTDDLIPSSKRSKEDEEKDKKLNGEDKEDSSSTSSDSTLNEGFGEEDCIDSRQNLLMQYIPEEETDDIMNWDLPKDVNEDDDILNDIESSADSSDDDEKDEEKRKEKKKKIKVKKEIEGKSEDVVEIDGDDEEKEEDGSKTKEIASTSTWKKDSLLVENLDTNSDSSDCEILETQEDKENFVKKKDKMGEILKRAQLDILVLDSSTDDSDIEFVGTSKHDTSQELDGEGRRGRRKIRAMLTVDKLDYNTIQANKEEKLRIERLEKRQKELDSMLTRSEQFKGKGMILDIHEGKKLIVHPKLVHKMKEHQRSGVRFMWDTVYESINRISEHPGYGCILAHSMGLGKTLQVIALVHTLFSYPDTKTNYVLIVCPLTTVLNWEQEFKMAFALVNFTPKINVFALSEQYKNKNEKYSALKTWQKNKGVIIMGYDCYISFTKLPENTEEYTATHLSIVESLIYPGPDLIVCDEGHLLNNGKTNRTKNLMRVHTKRRIILTGTPLQNNLNEYYYMVQFVKPNLLGTKKEYNNRFVNPIINGQYENSTAYDIEIMKKRSHVLHSVLKGTVQRYEAKELETYLPKKHDYVIMVRLHPVQVNLYKKYLEACASGTSVKDSLSILANYHMLQQIWTHPYLLEWKQNRKTSNKISDEADVNCNKFSDTFWKDIVPRDISINPEYGSKFILMLSIIEESVKVKDKLLIFSSSIFELDVIEHFLKLAKGNWQKGKNYLRMDGSVSAGARQRFCDLFNKRKEFMVLLVSHKVGGMGINLYAANRVILMDVCWNPSYDIQSIFRIYRFGQKKECYIYRLVSKGTMEEVVYERSVTKQAIAHRVVDEQQISRHYKCEDLVLYRCNLDYEETRGTLKRPADTILSFLIQKYEKEIIAYHEHQSLLQNLPDEELGEEEMKAAWTEYIEEGERQTIVPTFTNTPSTSTTSNNPGQNLLSYIHTSAGKGEIREMPNTITRPPRSNTSNNNNMIQLPQSVVMVNDALNNTTNQENKNIDSDKKQPSLENVIHIVD